MNKCSLATFQIRNLKTNRKLIWSIQANESVIVYHCGLYCDCTFYRNVTVESKEYAIEAVIKKHNKGMFELKRDRDREAARWAASSEAGSIPRPVVRNSWLLDTIRATDTGSQFGVLTAEEMRRIHGGLV